jgi:hypothetical protein
VQNINKGQSGRPCISASNESVVTVIQALTQSPKKSVRQCSHEIGVPKTSVYCIFWRVKWKPYIPRLLHAMIEDDPDRQIEFCEWFLHMHDVRESFPDFIVWSDEATFKYIVTLSQHSCVLGH